MQDVIHALRDGRCAGDAGGLNARGMEHAGKDGGGADHEVVQTLDDRTATCERAHDSSGVKVGHELAGSVEQRLDICRVGVAVAGLAQRRRRGDDGVTMYGSRDDDALRDGCGHGVEGHEGARFLVEHGDVALAPRELEFLGSRHVRDQGGSVARGIDEDATAHGSLGRVNGKALGLVGQAARPYG
mgnify:CR=1 FL=1